MPINTRASAKPAPYMKDPNGLYLSGGPFIGIVKNNLDPNRSGRLQVFIPYLGGADEDDKNSWITVSYSSPFRGQTRQRNELQIYTDQTADVTTTEVYGENSFQSYGMWFTLPDLNGRVLVCFANNDPSQGYWFGCVADSLDSHMTPAIGAVTAAADDDAESGGYIFDPDKYTTHAELKNYIELTDENGSEIPYRLPVSEPVLINQANSSPATPQKVIMLPHVYQTKQLGIQGLAYDFIRGTTSASSVRENPSQVFGVSTPGRLTSFANLITSQSMIDSLQQVINGDSSVDKETLTKKMSSAYRTGGHQFVMDDGTIDGYDQGIRIRSTAGNEILLDDTNGQIYVINSQGTAWVELSPSGYIDIFSAGGFSVRSQGDINFHADNNLNLNAKGAVNIHSDGDMRLDSASSTIIRGTKGTTIYDSASMSIGTGGKLTEAGKGVDINCGSSAFNVQGSAFNLPGKAGKVNDPKAITTDTFTDTEKQSGTNVWWSGNSVSSIVSRLPAHEPWKSHEIDGIKTSAVVYEEATDSGIVRLQGSSTRSGVRGSARGPVLTESDLAAQVAAGTICSLTLTETKALLATIARLESSVVATASNPGKKGKAMSTTPPKIGGAGSNYTNVGGTGQYACNSYCFAGKYQFGWSALVTVGFMKSSPIGNTNGQKMTNSSNWTGHMGVTSIEAFLNNLQAQEAAMIAYMNSLCKQVPAKLKSIMLAASDGHAQLAAFLAVSHMLGVGSAEKYYTEHINTNTGMTFSKGLTSDGYGSSPAQRWSPVYNNVLTVKGK